MLESGRGNMKFFNRALIITLALGLLLFLLSDSIVIVASTRDGLERITAGQTFNFVSWTLDALFQKAVGASMKAEKFLNGDQQSEVMRQYVGLVAQKAQLEAELTRLVSEPGEKDTQAIETAKKALDESSDYLKKYSRLAEATLQTQTEALLASIGFGLGGQILPPVLYHVTELPLNLIVSPRDVIQAEYEISLKAGLDTLQKEAIESEVFERLDRAGLVEPIGGMGAYPTMVMRTSDLAWLADTVAHEWGHNWLTFHPLGVRYFDSPQMKTINETTASIIGREVSLEMMKRHYPELVPLPVVEEPESGSMEDADKPTEEPQGFNFRRAMRETRVKVDALLAEGKISEAEAYMETRRAFFWEHGYPIRKLNQAYFAFYGSYNDVPGGGAAGNDPVGPAVQALRKQSASLYAFVSRIQSVRSFADLQLMLSQ